MALNKKEWGERNRNLSLKLFDEGFYYDWSLTTAFYSVVQYVENAIFPVRINGVYCTEIGLARRVCNLDGRHATRERLVYEVMGEEIGSYYKWLDDTSRTARYKTYKISMSSAKKAREYLLLVEEICAKFQVDKDKEIKVDFDF